ncbi:hypothetical protein ES703_85344 [subsurface metagenome]
MTHKHERQCWYCGSHNMEHLTNHVRCRDCGATFNVLPDLGPSPVTIVDAKTGGAPRVGRSTEYKPRLPRGKRR